MSNFFKHPLEANELNPDLPEQYDDPVCFDGNTRPVFAVHRDESVTLRHPKGLEKSSAYHTRRRFSSIDLTLAALRSQELIAEKTYYMFVVQDGVQNEVVERVQLRWVREL